MSISLFRGHILCHNIKLQVELRYVTSASQGLSKHESLKHVTRHNSATWCEPVRFRPPPPPPPFVFLLPGGKVFLAYVLDRDLARAHHMGSDSRLHALLAIMACAVFHVGASRKPH